MYLLHKRLSDKMKRSVLINQLTGLQVFGIKTVCLKNDEIVHLNGVNNSGGTKLLHKRYQAADGCIYES